jgi:hypothetical protein
MRSTLGRLQDLPHPPPGRVRMHSILGRVPGFAPPSPWEGQNAQHSGEGARSGEKLPKVKSLSTPATPPGRRPSARPTSPKAAKAAGRLQNRPHPPLGGSECEAFWGGCLERKNIRQSQITQHPNNPTRTTPSARPTSPKAAKAAGRLQNRPDPPPGRVRMRSILGRVPGAEKNSPEPNYSAPQQPHPDDALRPVRPPQKLLKQRGGWGTLLTLPSGRVRMRSILGRVPGAEKNSPKSNHSAPQQPHPDDAFGPSDLPKSC